MKTLADLLKEDSAIRGDVYEACGRRWTLCQYGELVLESDEIYQQLVPRELALLPAIGWERVTPKTPTVVEYDGEVVHLEGDKPALELYHVAELRPLIGKRVLVTVRELIE